MPAAQQVKFYRGSQSTYVVTNGNDSNSIQGTEIITQGGSPIRYAKEYNDAIYYATDTKVVWVNGVRYGYDASAEGGLQGAFISVSYTPPTSSENAKLVFTNLDGSSDEVELYKVASKTTAIDVTYDSNSKSYDVGLNIASDDEVLTQETTGLKVNLAMNYNPNTHYIQLWGKKNGSNEDILIDEIDATDFIKDGMIKNVSIVDTDGQGNSGRFLKIEWNADSDDHDPSVAEHGLTTYVDLSDFFDVITSDSSAISIDDYHFSFVVYTSKYLHNDDGVNGKGLVFNDASIDDQFSEIKNVSINGHAIGDSVSDSSLLLKATEIPIGTITVNPNSTEIGASDSVELAIAKLNKYLQIADSSIQAELDQVESTIGISADGTLGNALSGTIYDMNIGILDGSVLDGETSSTNIIQGLKKMDTHVKSIDLHIQELNYGDDDLENGDFTVSVNQINGQIGSDRGWIAEQALHGYITPTDGNISSADSINSAIEKIDGTISWHLVS